MISQGKSVKTYPGHSTTPPPPTVEDGLEQFGDVIFRHIGMADEELLNTLDGRDTTILVDMR